jgi:DNA-binding beta-propeller fold protein YncE
MRKNAILMSAAALTVATALLSACSSGASQGTNSGLPSTGASASKGLSDPDRSGIAPKYAGMARRGHAGKHNVTPVFTNHVIYINDSGTNAVDVIKYNHWSTYEGTISSGTNGVDGNCVDKQVGGVRHLYVANYINPNITEYDTAGNLVFTYSAGMSDAVNVATDKNGNVYEADFNGDVQNGGYVNEYAQQSNTVMASCSPGGNLEGIAVDRHGNVFVSYDNLTADFGTVAEYVGGLVASGCVATVEPITFGYVGGIALDRQGNLVVCDQTGPGFSGSVVDVLAPPYNAITQTLGSGYTDAFHVTIDMAGTRAYVTDAGAAAVDVVNYPAGTPITTIDSTSTTGVVSPFSAVDEHNLVVDNQGP